jgi:hypothetical protein
MNPVDIKMLEAFASDVRAQASSRIRRDQVRIRWEKIILFLILKLFLIPVL